MKIGYLLLVAITILSCSKQPERAEVEEAAVAHKSVTPAPKFTAEDIVPVQVDTKMVKIAGGKYHPFFNNGSDSVAIVHPFMMDETAVTNADFLEFLKANPQWTRSKVLKIYADKNYLHNWRGDLELPPDVSPDAPVTNVSWFAAEAYAKSVGKRLPTINEWEFTGQASTTKENASHDPEFTNYILGLYESQKDHYKQPVKQGPANFFGVYDMYGTVWEWTQDFNSVLLSNNNTEAGLYCGIASVNAADVRNYAAFLRYAMRASLKAKFTVNNVGFRCAKDI